MSQARLNTEYAPLDTGQHVGEEDDDPRPLKKQRRHANVYDAVAGRIAAGGFLAAAHFASKYRDTASSSSVAMPPEEVLFRRQNAPTRYAENDIYFAHESLSPEHQRLPDSDLLKTIHTYSSHFYDSVTPDRGHRDWRSMNETALVAMGILLEEVADEALGETGDMVFVEGVRDEEADTEDFTGSEGAAVSSKGRRRKRADTGGSSAGQAQGLDPVRRRSRKKRKQDPTQSDGVETHR